MSVVGPVRAANPSPAEPAKNERRFVARPDEFVFLLILRDFMSTSSVKDVVSA